MRREIIKRIKKYKISFPKGKVMVVICLYKSVINCTSYTKSKLLVSAPTLFIILTPKYEVGVQFDTRSSFKHEILWSATYLCIYLCKNQFLLENIEANLMECETKCSTQNHSKGQLISKAIFLETPLPKKRTKY